MFPQIYYPQLCITAVSVPGLKIGDQTDDGLRFIDNKRITGTIPDMVDEAVSFVKRTAVSVRLLMRTGSAETDLNTR